MLLFVRRTRGEKHDRGGERQSFSDWFDRYSTGAGSCSEKRNSSEAIARGPLSARGGSAARHFPFAFRVVCVIGAL
jgi:hypothetical protein